MIFGIEIGLLVAGLVMLFNGKTLGRNGTRHPRARWVGLLMVMCLPTMFAAGVVTGMIIRAAHPGEPIDVPALRRTFGVVEIVGVLLVAAVALARDRAIRRNTARAAAQRPSQPL